MNIDCFRKNLDKWYNDGHATMSMGYMCNHIAWLWKYRKISEQEMHDMTDKAVFIMKFM